MSNITIQPNASGTGTFSIASPNSNTSRTLTLPDTTGELLNDASSLASGKLTGALPAIDGSALTGVGASTTVGTVGTYAFLGSINYSTPPSPNAPGGTIAGSSLRYKDVDYDSLISPAGTWRIMGGGGNVTYTKAPCVWLRIS
tara:strand:- start:3166 stop:3594 length:429 start_codon:yes stop_codon:yes gene_type:complete